MEIVKRTPDGVHTIYELAPATYRFDEGGIVNAYLLVGETHALLIDTGVGIGDLNKVIRSITSLPLFVALSHRHADHDGGVSFYDEVYCSQDDMSKTYDKLSGRFARHLLLNGGKILNHSLAKYKLVNGGHNPKYSFIGEGSSFELGNRLIRVIATPGHTAGSLTFIDDKEKMMFMGDDVNPGLWLQLKGCLPISSWLTGAKRLEELAKTYKPFYGHGNGETSHEEIAQLIALCEKLLTYPKHKLKLGASYYPSLRKPGAHVLIKRKGIR
jgi:glyoxylase-like metal-dependent hydrolase (beta-lactamase superfamily II)